MNWKVPSRIAKNIWSVRIVISPFQLRRNIYVVGSQNLHPPSYESTTLRDRILTTFQKSFVSVSLFNFMDVSSISNWLNFVFTISSIH